MSDRCICVCDCDYVMAIVRDDCYNDDFDVPSIGDKAKNGHVLLYYYSTSC